MVGEKTSRYYSLHVFKEKSLQFGQLISQGGIVLSLCFLESKCKSTKAVSSSIFEIWRNILSKEENNYTKNPQKGLVSLVFVFPQK